jgi:hypothetical protein
MREVMLQDRANAELQAHLEKEIEEEEAAEAAKEAEGNDNKMKLTW